MLAVRKWHVLRPRSGALCRPHYSTPRTSSRHHGILLAAALLAGCGESSGPASTAATPGRASSAQAAAPARVPSAPGNVGQFVAGKDYTVLERVRFADSTGFEQPAEAFSVLLPKGWTHQGGILWKSLAACRGEMVSASWQTASPDGALRFVALPDRKSVV